MSHEQIIIDGLVREIERMKRNDENNQNSLAAYRKEVMDIGTRLSSLNNMLRSLKGKSVFPVEDPNSKGKFAFLESYPVKAQDSALPLPGSSPEIASLVKEINENPLNAMCDKEGQTESPLKESDRPTREQVERAIAGWNPPYSAPAEEGDDGLWHPSKDWKANDSASAEPAPGSDAEHPPVGYRLAKIDEKREPGYLTWMINEFHAGAKKRWAEPDHKYTGELVKVENFVANPIPANDSDSRLAESVAIPTEPARDLSADVERLEEWQEAGLTASMMWDVIQEMRKTLDCDGTTTPVERAERVMRTIDELRATAERLEAENAELRGELTAEKSKLRILKSEYSELETVIATVRKALG